MSDEDFLGQFEACTLSPDCFHHADHVRMAWLYLSRYDGIEAVARFSESLRRFATSLGKADRYNETVTWAFVLLIRERIARAPQPQTWDEFAAANSDVLDWKGNVLKKYYREETLSSSLAKSTFLLPDRLA